MHGKEGCELKELNYKYISRFPQKISDTDFFDLLELYFTTLTVADVIGVGW